MYYFLSNILELEFLMKCIRQDILPNNSELLFTLRANI